MAGALTERDFVQKIEKAGFRDVDFHDRRPVSVDELAAYPLFTSDLVALMRRLIPRAVQERIGAAIVVSARLRGGGTD